MPAAVIQAAREALSTSAVFVCYPESLTAGEALVALIVVLEDFVDFLRGEGDCYRARLGKRPMPRYRKGKASGAEVVWDGLDAAKVAAVLNDRSCTEEQESAQRCLIHWAPLRTS